MRKNGQRVDASWFNAILEAIDDNELQYDLTDNEPATALDLQEFDGDVISSVKFEFEVIRGVTVFANGVGYMQYKNSTWIWVFAGWDDEDGTDPGLTFTIDQVDSVGTLEVATSTGPGAGTLKIKRKSYNAAV